MNFFMGRWGRGGGCILFAKQTSRCARQPTPYKLVYGPFGHSCSCTALKKVQNFAKSIVMFYLPLVTTHDR
jgi:hypothetical protein